MTPKRPLSWLVAAIASASIAAVAADAVDADRVAQAEIAKAIASDPQTSRADVSVSVHDGVAHLTGSVRSAAVREHVEEIARRTDGVRAVTQDLAAPR